MIPDRLLKQHSKLPIGRLERPSMKGGSGVDEEERTIKEENG